MTTGKCYCRAVTYEIEGDIDYIVHCHCRNCRRASGAAFYSAGFLPESSFAITSGQANIREFNFPENPSGARCFCATCGGHPPTHARADQHRHQHTRLRTPAGHRGTHQCRIKSTLGSNSRGSGTTRGVPARYVEPAASLDASRLSRRNNSPEPAAGLVREPIFL